MEYFSGIGTTKAEIMILMLSYYYDSSYSNLFAKSEEKNKLCRMQIFLTEKIRLRVRLKGKENRKTISNKNG